ncbi:MAG: hypothetical protein EKK53_04555 [Burkholderiales bacterium]|nr:MAG: hypothetical protein EKK53_04555 [Burkholderiales bacterium]
MGLTTEQVHWIGGALIAATVFLMLLKQSGVLPWQRLDYLLPLLLVGYGIESAADVWLHGDAVPSNYGSEARQHLLQGGVMLAAGLIQGLVLGGTLQHRLWQLAVPLSLAFTGVVFWLHVHQGMEHSMALVMTQHRSFAVSLLVAAGAKAVAVLGGQRARAFEVAWLLPLLLFGIELMIYTEQM